MFVNANPEGNLAQFPWPHFDANSAVGTIANAIAANRIEQQQNLQKTLAQSIQQMAAEDSANKALQQAGGMEGLPAPGGLSGTAGLADYIKLVNAQKQSELADYYRSHGGLYDAQAQAGGYRPPGAGATAGRIPDPDNPGAFVTSTQLFNRQQKQANLAGQQASDIQDQGVTQPMQHGYVMNPDTGKMEYASTDEQKANPQLVSPGDPLKPTDPNAPPPIFTPQYVKDQIAARQALLQQQKTLQQKMLNPPQGTGQPGAGAALTPQDQQALDWANKNPNDPRAAQIQARLGNG